MIPTYFLIEILFHCGQRYEISFQNHSMRSAYLINYVSNN